MTKVPSPCVAVCKFKREGHCIGCSMTKAQKSMFKQLKKNRHRKAFIEMLTAQQSRLGRFEHWAPAYKAKCFKKNARPTKAIRKAA